MPLGWASPSFRELGVRVRCVEVEAVARIGETIEGDGPRLWRRGDVAGDALRAIAQAGRALAVRGGREEVFAPTAPAEEGDGLGIRPIEDVTGDPLAPGRRAVGLAEGGRVEVRPAPGLEPAGKRDGRRLRRGEDVSGDALESQAGQVEVEDDLGRGVVDAAEDAVLLEQRHAADQLGIEPVAQGRRLAGRDLRDHLVEVAAEEPGEDPGDPFQLAPLDLLDLDPEPRGAIAARLDVDAGLDVEAETLPVG